MTPAARRLRAQIGGCALHAQRDSREIAARARRGLEARFVREVREKFPDLDDHEIERRAQMKRREFYARLSFRAVQARSRRQAA